MFSIIIPTFNNLEYLKLCLKSINKNSKYKHQVIPHVNVGDDGSKDYLKNMIIYYMLMMIFIFVLNGMKS